MGGFHSLACLDKRRAYGAIAVLHTTIQNKNYKIFKLLQNEQLRGGRGKKNYRPVLVFCFEGNLNQSELRLQPTFKMLNPLKILPRTKMMIG